MSEVPNKSVSFVEQSPTREWEDWARLRGYLFVVGIDEAGRGPLAGPVVAACCYLPEGHSISGINDSKQLLQEVRGRIYQEIISHPKVRYASSVVEPEEIDRINILQATFKAMRQALAATDIPADFILVDGHLAIPQVKLAQRPIIQGDGISESIAAASIIAKEVRDQIMQEHHRKYPGYGFDRHKGYATQEHLQKLMELGPSPIHRKSFGPVKKSVNRAVDEMNLFDLG